MWAMNNYVDKDSLELLINEIEKCIENKCYISALTMALTIPDILGKVAYPKTKKSKTRYIKWFDENVKNIAFEYLYSASPLDMDAESPKMNGIVCFAMRCKLFHEGMNDIEKDSRPMRINEFVLSLTDEDYVRGEYAGVEYLFSKYDPVTGDVPKVSYLYVSCRGISKEIVNAAKEFIKKNPNLKYPKLRVNNGGGKINDWLFIR